MLERHRARQEAEELVVGQRWNNEQELIFTSSIGTPLDPESFGRTVPKICKDAGLGHWSIHELRHSCASLLIAMEVPLEAVAEQMGHASIRVTKDVYGHLMPRSRARAAEAMRTILYDDSPVDAPETSNALATSLATSGSEKLKILPSDEGFSGPPGSRSRHLGIKRGMHMVGLVRWGRNHPRIKEILSGGVGFVRWRRIGLWEEMWDFGVSVVVMKRLKENW